MTPPSSSVIVLSMKTTQEAVRDAVRILQARGKAYNWLKDVAILAEELAGRELDITDIHGVMRADQSDGIAVLYPCDDPRAVAAARHGSFTAIVAGEERHLVHYLP